SRRYADRPVEWLEREGGAVIRIERAKEDALRRFVDLVHPNSLRQWLLKGRGEVRAGQRAKQRNGAAGRPIARRLDVDQVDRQRVARLGALDIEGPGLGIDEGVLDRLAGQVLLGADPAGEAILGIEVENVAWLDPGDRVDATEGPGVLLLGWNDPL